MAYTVKITDGKASVYNANTGQRLNTLTERAVTAFLVDQETAQVQTADGKSYLYRIPSGQKIRTL